uniref:Uncharacterized protein n=1 Tax=Anopheles coluzzii TaxID=1518534 RepID=A0A8W7Q126_ANOCL
MVGLSVSFRILSISLEANGTDLDPELLVRLTHVTDRNVDDGQSHRLVGAVAEHGLAVVCRPVLAVVLQCLVPQSLWAACRQLRIVPGEELQALPCSSFVRSGCGRMQDAFRSASQYTRIESLASPSFGSIQ